MLDSVFFARIFFYSSLLQRHRYYPEIATRLIDVRATKTFRYTMHCDVLSISIARHPVSLLNAPAYIARKYSRDISERQRERSALSNVYLLLVIPSVLVIHGANVSARAPMADAWLKKDLPFPARVCISMKVSSARLSLSLPPCKQMISTPSHLLECHKQEFAR